MRDDGFSVGVIVGMVVGACFTFLFSGFERWDVPIKLIEQGQHDCLVNEGLKSLDQHTITCMNGAQFDVK